jgi:tRNA G18 (ribose-2'-O)-methylase SpoU
MTINKENWSLWKRNVVDKYKSMTDEQIRRDLAENKNPIAVCMEHWRGDFNIGTLIRNANAFNVEKVFYLGKRKIDRRGAVGTHHYVDIVHMPGVVCDLVDLKKQYTFIAIDNNIPNTEKLDEFSWNTLEKPPLVFFGEEGYGLTQEVLDLCDYRVEIEQYGSVRSLNVGTSSGLVLYELSRHLKNSKVFDRWQRALYDGIGNELNVPCQLTLL